jgi:hypothetical protein
MSRLAIIYGTTHLLQVKPPLHVQNRKQSGIAKLEYARELLNLMRHWQTEGIVEETNPCYPSIAEELAHIGIQPYRSIDMPSAEKERLGVKQTSPITDVTDPKVQEQIRIREDYMFKCLKELLPDQYRVLVICGLFHVRGLRERFQNDGAEVIIKSCVDNDWCPKELLGEEVDIFRLLFRKWNP